MQFENDLLELIKSVTFKKVKKKKILRPTIQRHDIY